jgi:hypothetical protein
MNDLIPRVKLNYPEFNNHFIINEFLGWSHAYSFYDIDGIDWYLEFVERIFQARDNSIFLPVYRMGDGEYTFLLQRGIFELLPFFELDFRQKLRRIFYFGGHKSGTKKDGFEIYTKFEKEILHKDYIKYLQFISQSGIITQAFDNGKTFGPYFKYVYNYFNLNNIILNNKNFYHGYHVYAFFFSSYGDLFLKDQNVLIFSSISADDEVKLRKILFNKGVKSIQFYTISSKKSMLDKIKLETIGSNINMALISAGIGSANIIYQLRHFNFPCIDIGTIIGTYLNPERVFDRPYMANDNIFDLNKVKFMSEFDKSQVLNLFNKQNI